MSIQATGRIRRISVAVLIGVMGSLVFTNRAIASGCGYLDRQEMLGLMRTAFIGTVRSVGEPTRQRFGYIIPNLIDVGEVLRGEVRTATTVEVHTLPPPGWKEPTLSAGEISYGVTSASVFRELRPGERVGLAFTTKEPPFDLTHNCSVQLSPTELRSVFSQRWWVMRISVVVLAIGVWGTALVVLVRRHQIRWWIRALLMLLVTLMLVVVLLRSRWILMSVAIELLGRRL